MCVSGINARCTQCWKCIAKSFQCLIKRHNIKTYGEVEVQLHAYAASCLMTLLCHEIYELYSTICALRVFGRKGKVVRVHATKAYKGSGVIALLIPDIELVGGERSTLRPCPLTP